MNQGRYFSVEVGVGPLAQLFALMRLEEAVHSMCDWDSAKLQMEISQAFVHVPWAPSAFLQCVNLYGHLTGKPIVLITQWIEVRWPASTQPRSRRSPRWIVVWRAPCFQSCKMR
jgi:hypothetical protein